MIVLGVLADNDDDDDDDDDVVVDGVGTGVDPVVDGGAGAASAAGVASAAGAADADVGAAGDAVEDSVGVVATRCGMDDLLVVGLSWTWLCSP